MKVAVPHRPYTQLRGTEPSVTTILEMLPKPGLPWGAAKETAMFAVYQPEKWQSLSDPEAVDALRRHHKGVWDGRAAMGTHFVHSVAEEFAAGNAVDVERLLDETIAHDSGARSWKDRDRQALTEECLGYVMGLEKWWRDFAPTPTATEAIVRWPGLFIGQTDLRADILWPDGVFDTLVDYKSTAKQEDNTGVYNDSWTLQLAMYGMAHEQVVYRMEEDPKLKTGYRLKESYVKEWDPPERYMIAHFRGNEDYTAFAIDVRGDHQAAAMHLAKAYPLWKNIPERPRVVRAEGSQ